MRPPGAGAPPGQWPIAVRPRRGAELCAAFCAGEGALRDPRPSQAVIVLQSRGRGLVDGGAGDVMAKQRAVESRTRGI